MTLMLCALAGAIVGFICGVLVGCVLATASAQDDMQRKEMFEQAQKKDPFPRCVQ